MTREHWGSAVTRPRIAIVDDHELVRAGLASMVRQELNADVVLEADDPHAVLELRPLPDIVLLDLNLGTHIADASMVATLQSRGCRVLVVSALTSTDLLVPLLDAGVSGVVSKRESPETLVRAIRTVLDDGLWTSPEIAALLVSTTMRPQLSAAQERVLVLYASGMTMESVARHLGIGIGTVNTHLKRARAKYAEVGRAMPSRVDVYREARRDGLIGE